MGSRNVPEKHQDADVIEQDSVAPRKAAVQFIDQQFGVAKTVAHLQTLMSTVTKDKITPETVNAACNCVQNLNLTIKTAMQAARFLSDK